MKKCFFILAAALIAFGTLLVSCNANVEAPAEELVSISFENGSARALSSNLEGFAPETYYWKYAAKKADSSNLVSGQTATYDEAGAKWIKEGSQGLGTPATQTTPYESYKVQGFSQGLWNFKLFAYKDVSTTETPDYRLVYSGETTGVLLQTNGNHRVDVVVSPAQTGNGTLIVKITGDDKIVLNPASGTLNPNTKIRLGIEKIVGATTTPVRTLGFIDADYSNDDLEPGTYKVTVQFTNDDATVIYAAGSVVSTVYSNLTTTINGSLNEVVTYADFGAQQNPDIITETIGTDAITQGTSSETVSFTSSSQTSKVTASMPTAAAKSLITEMEQALDAKTSTSTSTTSDLTLNLSVNTTAATETSITYEIGMEATLVYLKKDATGTDKTTTKSTVETLNKFVTVEIDLQKNLQDVAVIHGTNSMTSCTQTEFNNKTESDDPNGIGFFYYDSANGKLHIKTWKFSPFNLTYSVPKYVAAIGSVRYTTLKQALDAVADGDTVTLLENISLEISKDNAVVVDGNYAAFLVKPFNELTIDGNGKTITLSASESGIHDAILLDANGGTGGANIDNVWNIKDLNLETSGFQVAIMLNAELDKVHVANIDNVNIVTDGESIYANGEVTVNVSDSSLTHSGEYAPGKDWVYYSAVIAGYNGSINLVDCSIDSFGNAVATFPSGGSITLTDCDVTATVVEGATVSGNIICSRNEDYSSYPEYTGNSTITVNSGNYDGTVLVSQGWTANKTEHLYSTVKISGGDFTNFGVNVSHASGCDLAVEDHVVITGGTYDVDPGDYVAEGYIAAPQGTNPKTWLVRPLGPEDYVASVTHGEQVKKYLSLNAAFDATETGDTVTLLKDTSVGSEISIPSGKTITLVLNGKTIEGTEHDKDKAVFRNAGTFTINGSAEESAIEADASAVIGVAGSVLMVNGGSYSNSYFENNEGSYIFDIKGTATIDSVTLTGAIKGIRAKGSSSSVTVSDSSADVTPGWGLFAAGDRGVLIVSSGSYKTTYSEQRQMIDIKDNGKVTINGGSFQTVYTGSGDAPALAVFNGSGTTEGGGNCLTITDGNFKYAGELIFLHPSSVENLSVTGGTFYTDPTEYVSDGYYAQYHPAVDPAPEYWTVEAVPAGAIFALINNETQAVSFITASNFDTITGFGDGDNPGVPANHTLKLLKNYTQIITDGRSGNLINFSGNNIALDLNTYTYTINANGVMTCFSVTDENVQNVTFKNGKINSSDGAYLFSTNSWAKPEQSQFHSVDVSYRNVNNPWTYGTMSPTY